MKLLLFLLIAICSINAAEVVVLTEGGFKSIFLKLENLERTFINADDWQLSFKSGNIAGTIRSNKNTKVYKALELTIYDFKTPIAINDLVDKSKFAEVLNDASDWKKGAFNDGGSPEEDFDYGWGEYQQGSGIFGTKLFVIESTIAGKKVQKQFVINSISNNKYFIEMCDLDGTNEIANEIDKATFSDKNFVYFNIADNMVLNVEPNINDWDLLFTEYVTPVQAGPDVLNYTVAGILQNPMLWVTELEGDISDVPADETFSPMINTIGYDWKTFDNGYVIEDRTYFAQRFTYNQDQEAVGSGDIYRIRFTNYEGGNAKASTFDLTTAISSVEKENNFLIYPNIISQNESFNVVWSNSNKVINSMKIINSNGEEVLSKSLTSANELSNVRIRNNLASGLYFVVFNIGSEVFTQKLMVK